MEYERNPDGSLKLDESGNPIPVKAPPPPTADPELQAKAARIQPVVESPAVRYKREAEQERARAAALEAQLAQRAAAEQQHTDAHAATVQRQLEENTALLRKMQEDNYRLQLDGYRKDVIALYKGQLIAGMVGGNTPQEIDQSAQAAHQEWTRVRTEALREAAAARAAAPPAAAPPASAPGAAVPAAGAVPEVAAMAPVVAPPNPAYVPPGAAQSWPTVATGSPTILGGQEAAGVAAVTTERAVRSGLYGANRERLIDGLRRGQVAPVQGLAPPSYLGPTPVGVPHQVDERGNYQPHGYPSGPIPGTPQQRYAPPAARVPATWAAPRATLDAGVAQAQEALARTHAGQNPLASGGMARETAAYAAAQGLDPQAAHAQRFNPTPPDAANGQ